MSLAETGGYTARHHWDWERILLFGALILIAALYAGVILDSKVGPPDYGFAVLLYLCPVVALLARPHAPGVRVLSILFVSLSVLFFESSPGPLYIPHASESANRLVGFFSQSLMLLFPFAFVHFSLIFPAAGQWERRRIRRILLFIYAPLVILVILYAVVLFGGTDSRPYDESAFIVIPLGFLLGLGIFLRNYFYSLTSTEKNRLRVMLIGCLAGGLPVILAGLSRLHLLAGLALLLVPLFPVSLAIAVLKEDFAEPAPFVQKLLRVSMVVAGGITAFFLASLLLSVLFGVLDPSLSLISLMVSLGMVIPLVRWSGSYVGLHFRLPVRRRWRDPAQALSAFQPISPNPYIVGNPVRTPEMFFGRTEDFEFIRTKLEAQRQGCVILLCGERRAGKTSILYQILNRRLGLDLLPVFLDMQELVVESDHEFANGLAARLSRGLEEQGIQVAPSSLASGVKDYLQLTEFIAQIMKAIGNRRLLLLFDEYELIGEKVRDGRLTAEVGDYLNSLLERHARLNMVFTGSRPLEADPAFSRLLGKSSYREISFLALPDAVSLICSPLAGRISFENQAVSDLILLTRGHPFFVQLLCQLVVELVNELRRTMVTSELVEQATARLLDSPPPQLLYKWSGYSRNEKLVLAALGTLLKRPGSYAPADRLARLILSLPENRRGDLDGVSVRIVLEDLRRKGALDRDQNRYGFTMDLVRRYIKAEHTVWSVLGEETAAR